MVYDSYLTYKWKSATEFSIKLFEKKSCNHRLKGHSDSWVKNGSIPASCLHCSRIRLSGLTFSISILIRIRIGESRGSWLYHVWTCSETPVFSRFPSYVCVTVGYPSPCHQSHWPTEEDISAERRGDCVLVRGTPSSSSSSRWSCHGLINDSRSAEHQQIRAAHAHKTQHAHAQSVVKPALCPFQLSIKQQW